jgi:hypothetical protein
MSQPSNDYGNRGNGIGSQIAKGTWLAHARVIKNSSRNMGIYCLGGRGTGKSWELSLAIAWQDYLAGIPQVIYDPLGTVSQYFCYKLVRTLTYLPKAARAKYWERVIYCDLSGREGFVTPFPLYYRQGDETLQDIAERLLTVVELSNPGLVTNAPVTWPSTRRLGVNAGALLASLGLQITELEDLLFNTLEWERTGRFAAALSQYPSDAAPAVSYFRNHYLPMSRTDKNRLVSPFLDHVFKLTSDRNLRAVFAARTPSITWKDIAVKGQTVIFDFSGIRAPITKRFALLWTFSHLYEFMKQRDRTDTPFGIIIDEFAALATKVAEGTNPLAVLLDEFIQQYMRNSNIWLTVAHQSIQQLDDQLRNTVLSLGNYLFGQAPTMEAARLLADAVFLRDPYWVKHYRQTWGRTSRTESMVIAEEPVYFPLDEQRELFAQQIRRLPQWQFLLRPAEGEGSISTEVFPITIRSVDQDPVTGEYHYPDPQLMDRLFPKLAAKSGSSVSDILHEQETRLIQGMPQQPPSAAEDTSRQPAPLPDDSHPEQPKAKTDPAHRTLTEDHVKLLTYLIAHPDQQVSEVNQKAGIRTARLAQIREELTAQGFLQELTVSTGSTKGGRPVKYLIPTLKAREQLGSDPPKGRGGAIHRQVQRMVVNGALAKGYSAMTEHAISTGIVDVHLQKGAGMKIAVEICIASKPEREIAHFQSCIAGGYDQIYGLILDDQLRERTATLIRESFSPQEAGKIRLLPLGLLSQVG